MRLPKSYLVDCVTIIVFMVLHLLVLALVLREVLRLSPRLDVTIAIVGAAAAVGIFATAALLAVLIHLRRHRESLYQTGAPDRPDP